VACTPTCSYRHTTREARQRNPLEFAAVVRLGVLDLYTRTEAVPFGLAVDGEQLLLGIYDDEGNLRACLHGDDPALVAWGEAQFENLRAGAERVRSPGDIDKNETAYWDGLAHVDTRYHPDRSGRKVPTARRSNHE
jgi:hypothetical protein